MKERDSDDTGKRMNGSSTDSGDGVIVVGRGRGDTCRNGCLSW